MSRVARALVTGGNGFIGRRLVARLLDEGAQVVVLALPSEVVDPQWQDSVSVVRGDIRQLAGLGDQIGPVDTVFHLAAIVSDWGPQAEHIAVTVDGTRQALQLAQQNKARFVITSSIACYASSLASGRLEETMPVGKPASAYEFCKQEQERVTFEAANTGLEVVVVRPANVYGVGSGPWVERMRAMLAARRPVLVGDGKYDAGLCHVDNLVQLLWLAGIKTKAVGEVFNAADNFGVTWHQYLHRLSTVFNLPKPRAIPAGLARALAPVLESVGHTLRWQQPPPLTRLALRLTGGPNRIAIDKAQRLLGYRPLVTLQQAMVELAASQQESLMSERKVAWITGSTSGVGRHLTRCLLDRGWYVLATGRNEDLLHQVAEDDQWEPSRVLLGRLDVQDSASWEVLRERLMSRWGRLDLLLNVAAYLSPDYPSVVSDQDIDLHLDTNVKGVIKGCRTATQLMVEQGKGHIVNIASLGALATSPGIGLYCASKFAVRSYSLGLGMELRDKGVAVTVMCPDAIDTPMLKQQQGREEGAATFSGTILTLQDIEKSLFETVLPKQPLEVCLPGWRGWVLKLGNGFPAMALKLMGYLNARGRKRQAQVMARHAD